ncbi:ubiquitin carboxyl-terminal hydrolase 8-like [Andrographis paniculata]|uniref:ubiquitin carboxyl-terminal hydrolase 8-like n=1 Tax=Andrographis paniculata TaxID=175694 RepID=UPI0021E88CB1|nr:ubiquitin carboxyl-terminal hydrolase 8-like [Andrographis paniculata]
MSRSLKRPTITAVVAKALLLLPPSLVHLYDKSTHFVFPLLRRFLFGAIHFMESLLFTNDDDDFLSTPFEPSFVPSSFTDPVESMYLVSFRWWKEAVCGGGAVDGMNGVEGVLYDATVRMNGGDEVNCDGEVVVGGFGDSEILVGMRREGETLISGEEGVSGGVEDLALVSEWMFFTALKWHYDRMDVVDDSSFPREDSVQDAFAIQIRIFFASEIDQLVIKIIRKDNEAGAFHRVCQIFCRKSEMLQIWDFSGQTNQFFIEQRSSVSLGQSVKEVLLELQVYDSLRTIMDSEWRKTDMMVDQSMADGPSSSSSLRRNGTVDKVHSSSRVGSVFSVTGALGLTGLYNLGNTCFMNSAIQCLAHTPKLVDYFLGNFRKDLNFENPLGMNGKLAIVFGDLLRKLWAPGAATVSPRIFKSTISKYSPQFSGYNQHDSQEFLSFLLDGLHEDLNRVKSKPYIQAKDDDDRPDEVVADEYWSNHLSRNDSIIVDLCQGQYRSTLVCPVCKKSSVTFDPFMYLSLPLPFSTLRKMTLTVLNTDGTTLPHPVTISVPDNGTLKNLVEALGTACSLRDNGTLLIAEIYNNSILRVLDDLDDSIELIRDYDQLVVYRLPKDMDDSPLVVFMHQQEGRRFGIPLVARMPHFSQGSEMHEFFCKLINPFLLAGAEFLSEDASQENNTQDGEVVDGTQLNQAVNSINETESDMETSHDFEFYMEFGNAKVMMDEPIPMSYPDNPLKVIVTWPENMIRRYDTSILSLLPEVCKPALSLKWNQDSISLYKCVDAFLKEEPLGPDDMWYCPKCKERRQASKKLDLWRLPKILVIHLKRFSYTRFLKNKLESFVDFPVEDFDLSDYVIQNNDGVCHRYRLYAISNHYGGMGGGHYTAFTKNRLSQWYEFDDSHVFPVSEDQIKTQAAYVLFYKRI